MNASTARPWPEASDRADGFSLIEVIIAMALLAMVMLSISGLFIQGSKSIKDGKEMTEGLAQATDVLEDIDALSYRRVYAAFGAADTDTSFTADTRTNTFASRWQAQIEEAVWEGYATIDLLPLGLNTVDPTCVSTNFGCGQAIRVTVTVHWQERGQAQRLSLATMRF